MWMPRVILLVVGLNTVITLGSVVFGYVYLRSHSTAGLEQVQQIDKVPVPQDPADYVFYPVDKIVVNLRDEDREHYFVLDLALQGGAEQSVSAFKQAELLVRNAVVGSLSTLPFNQLRALSLTDLQSRLEDDLRKSFSAKGLDIPFSSVLVSKMLVQ